MARLASQSQGGFYPTPPEEMELINNRLKVIPGEQVNILDPCAGEGDALRQMADHLEGLGAVPVTYGVELEQERAQKAGQILDRVIAGAYEGLRASKEVFSAMYLNPPYDENFGIRTEVTFLRNLTAPQKYLQPGGVFVFCVPQQILDSAATLLAHRLKDIAVYRFTDKNYSVFNQVVVFGYRRPIGEREDTKMVQQWLRELGCGGHEKLPPLDEVDGVTFLVPAATGDVKIFRDSMLAPEEIMKDIENSALWGKINRVLMPPHLASGATLKKPVLPLKPGHYAIAIAAGAVGGNMGTHILKGVTKKVTDVSEEMDADGENTKIIKTDRHITTVRIFSPEGVFELE